jgi:hypothetical protein
MQWAMEGVEAMIIGEHRKVCANVLWLSLSLDFTNRNWLHEYHEAGASTNAHHVEGAT